MFLTGAATGHALADVLTGEACPSAKLPVTFPLSENDVTPPCLEPRCFYHEGLAVAWKGLIGAPVAFEFGHGLSYARFG
jgi:beta-glucosidase